MSGLLFDYLPTEILLGIMHKLDGLALFQFIASSNIYWLRFTSPDSEAEFWKLYAHSTLNDKGLKIIQDSWRLTTKSGCSCLRNLYRAPQAAVKFSCARGFLLLALDILSNTKPGLALDIADSAIYDQCGHPLHAAARAECFPLAEYILRARLGDGSMLTRKSNFYKKKSVLDLTASSGNFEMICLISPEKVASEKPLFQKLLDSRNEKNVLRILRLQTNVKPFLLTKDLVNRAAEFGMVEVVKVFASYGPERWKGDSFISEKFLEQAIKSDNLEMVQYAYALCYDLLFPVNRLLVEARDNSYNYTVSAGLNHPFVVACRVNASMKIITWLFETLKDGSVLGTVRYLYYPESLFFACMHDNLPLVIFLIENGWQKFIRLSVEGHELIQLIPYGLRRSLGIDRSGQIDLMGVSSLAIVEYLLANGADPSLGIPSSIDQENVDRFNLLLESGADRNFTRPESRHPAFRALLASNSNFFRYYREQEDFREIILQKTYLGETALDVFCQNSCASRGIGSAYQWDLVGTVKELVGYGVDPILSRVSENYFNWGQSFAGQEELLKDCPDYAPTENGYMSNSLFTAYFNSDELGDYLFSLGNKLDRFIWKSDYDLAFFRQDIPTFKKFMKIGNLFIDEACIVLLFYHRKFNRLSMRGMNEAEITTIFFATVLAYYKDLSAMWEDCRRWIDVRRVPDNDHDTTIYTNHGNAVADDFILRDLLKSYYEGSVLDGPTMDEFDKAFDMDIDYMKQWLDDREFYK